MTNKLGLAAIAYMLSFNAAANLESQLGAIHQQEKAEVLRLSNAAEAKRQRALEAENNKLAQQRKQAKAAAEKEARRKLAAQQQQQMQQQKLDAEALSDKNRKLTMEDRLFELELEERRMALDEKKAMSSARVNRADDFIDTDVQLAETAVSAKQAEIDIRKANAAGDNQLKSKVGDALIEEAKNPTEINIQVDNKVKENW
ncbi:hypothetical protein DBZ36_08000 [Alginatibacterium sediminis]|uniref:DUF5384 family protein n=1 Tax=Alginatibacterium sediminis TaxID=2164068 RepID=A0A420EI65_9ALTE|nr:DUF5384 family protein [Alginatibacterium sediminis]RKF20370.1 hypothetical protein DBZ36_08000 [Alginatibacterium sediminis]